MTNIEFNGSIIDSNTDFIAESRKFYDLMRKDWDDMSLEERKLVNSVRALNLSERTIIYLPSWMNQFKNLQVLILHNSYLSKLPSSIKSLKSKLEWLDLSSNSFHRFPREICSLKSLRFLDLCLCSLEHIDACISGLQNLQSLDLSYNMLTRLPKEIKNLKKLRHFDISHNAFPPNYNF